jgi:dethiobiotin synthetase
VTRPALRVAVTGTDTGVGKTVAACALVLALRARGLAVGAMKPVETGVAPGAADTDAARLRRAAGGRDAIDDVCPCAYAEPLAPWVAAERAGRSLDVARMDAAFARVAGGRDAVVVEGAGGLLVPLTRTLTLADLASRWALDLVVVAPNRLGVINHALLTVREAERRALAVRAVALVDAVDDADGVAERTNADALTALLAPAPLVRVPRLTAEALGRDASLADAGAPLADLLLGVRCG